MVTGWIDLGRSLFSKSNREFVSVDARAQYDVKSDHSAYEMLSKDQSGMVTSLPPVQLSPSSGLKTPDYYGQTARYQPPTRSFSSPRPPTSPTGWDASETYARPMYHQRYYTEEEEDESMGYKNMNPLGMNRI